MKNSEDLLNFCLKFSNWFILFLFSEQDWSLLLKLNEE